MKSYNVPINSLFIIESLESGQHRSGKWLYEDLSAIGYKNDFFKSSYVEIDSKISFFKEIDEIKNEVKTKKLFPIIHIEAHGNENGFVIGDTDEQVNWEEFLEKMSDINTICRNNLVLNTAFCFGSYINLSLPEMFAKELRSPFLVNIGPQTEISEIEIKNGFSEFYHELFSAGDFSKAFKNMTTETKLNYVIYSDQFIGQVVKQLITMYERKTLKSLYERFLMVDLYEENRLRFPLFDNLLNA